MGEGERKTQLLDLARDEAQTSDFGQDPLFANLWQGAADMLTSYSDTTFVSAEYARELSEARTQAIEVERVSDDPPERIEAWLASVNEAAVRQLDLDLLLDLLRLESDGIAWAAGGGRSRLGNRKANTCRRHPRRSTDRREPRRGGGVGPATTAPWSGRAKHHTTVARSTRAVRRGAFQKRQRRGGRGPQRDLPRFAA